MFERRGARHKELLAQRATFFVPRALNLVIQENDRGQGLGFAAGTFLGPVTSLCFANWLVTGYLANLANFGKLTVRPTRPTMLNR